MMIGNFVFKFVQLILKQWQQPAGASNDLSEYAPKVTGMLIEMPNIDQLFEACQSLDNLARKVGDATQLIMQAQNQTQQITTSSNTSS